MTTISNDREFRAALDRLDATRQRVLAARFVEHVLPLCTDERIGRALAVAADASASAAALAEALRAVKAATIDCHARCGSEGDWEAQAGYFVARAAAAALTPHGQLPAGTAWQAAMSARMARTSKAIVTGETGSEPESAQQYAILSAYMNT
ncbi:MAG: hypothetical protein R3F42_04675 [Pseudomonadota bacterium]